MDEIFKRILDKLADADFWIALGFLAAGYVWWRWIGTTATNEKKVLRRQIGTALLLALVAGRAIWVNHLFFLPERGFRKILLASWLRASWVTTRSIRCRAISSRSSMRNSKKKRRGSRLKFTRAAK